MKKTVTTHDIYGATFEVDPGQLSFRPSVYGVLVEDNKVLLVKQWDGYDFPGGGVELDETVDEALKREVLEETGLTVEVGKPLHSSTSFFTSTHSKKFPNRSWNAVLIFFSVKKMGGVITNEHLEEEEKAYATGAEWIPLNEIGKIKFINSAPSLDIIRAAIQN